MSKQQRNKRQQEIDGIGAVKAYNKLVEQAQSEVNAEK
jgi:hypothetical protein